MKKILNLIFLLPLLCFSQDIKKEDVNTNGSNKVGINLGLNINESTGKVNESVTITQISCRSIDFPVGISYNGQNVFDQAQFRNKYFPTSVLGLGWNMNTLKIFANTKETVSRDDDTFFLNGIELICVKRPNNDGINTKIWEFKTKTKTSYKIKYYEYEYETIINFPGPSYNSIVSLDYWEVIDEKGKIYIYGNSNNSRESVLSWGNWIGDSNDESSGNSKIPHTISWNISKIYDQWNNFIDFQYLKTEQPNNAFIINKQTEASYLSQITSGTGEKITFSYLSKTPVEFYEPNTESSEPDAYQERYEKLYLNDIKTFDSNNTLISNNIFTYELATVSSIENTKRYLTQITKKNILNNNLPPIKFEYNTTGVFAGSIKKKTLPDGGSLNYEYQENTLFTNNGATELNGVIVPSNSVPFAKYYCDNYKLELYTNGNNLSYPSGFNEKVNSSFLIIRNTWNGRKWNSNRFDIPSQIGVYITNGTIKGLDNAKFIFGNDYYAFLCYNRDNDIGTLYMFHLLSDGTWKYSTQTMYTAGDNDNLDEDPVLLSGDNFIAVGTNIVGQLYTFVWNGDDWNRKDIFQNQGNFHYGVNNNFILVLDNSTGYDMPTLNQNYGSHYDKYYIHYLDAEKEWQTRSWTSQATTSISNVNGKSFFYPSNSMASFVAAGNPEYILKWNKNYDLYSATSLGAYNDNYPFLSINNNIFSGMRMGDTSRSYIFKAAAINGHSFNITTDFNIETEQGFGKNKLLGLKWNGQANSYTHTLYKYNPNANSWQIDFLPMIGKPFNQHYMTSYAFTNEIFMAGHNIYKINNNGYQNALLASSYDYPQSAISGGDYIFSSFWSPGANSSKVGETKYFYVDKKDGEVKSVLWNNYYFNLWTSRNIKAEQFGGKYPFFSPKNMFGLKLLDYKYNNIIKDIVIKKITVDNSEGQVFVNEFVFEDSNTLMDDKTVVYGLVTKKEKGAGNASNGYIKTYYDKGTLDMSKTGLVIKQEVYDSDNQKIGENSYSYTKKDYNVYNSNFKLINKSHNWLKTNSLEKIIHIGSGVFTLVTNYNYDDNLNLIYTSRLNSKNKLEESTILYSELIQYVNNKNFIGFVSEKIDLVDNIVVSFQKSNWTQDGNKVYINETLSGPSESLLRVNKKINKVDNYGNVIETSNGLGLVNSILLGYNYKYPIATITNQNHDDVILALEVSYSNLQNMSGNNLKTELLKLYNNLPSDSMISINIYDNKGKIVTFIDERKNETNYIYDEFDRLKYTTDSDNNILEHKKYNKKNN